MDLFNRFTSTTFYGTIFMNCVLFNLNISQWLVLFLITFKAMTETVQLFCKRLLTTTSTAEIVRTFSSLKREAKYFVFSSIQSASCRTLNTKKLNLSQFNVTIMNLTELTFGLTVHFSHLSHLKHPGWKKTTVSLNLL